ncbi:MAG: hypothetical protein HYX65_06180 [Gemmatimonadetes bacterium]|nr:hypothetical protein [Gemmatimonadota bacterium]
MRAILVVRSLAVLAGLGLAAGCAEVIGAAPRRPPVFVRRVTVPRFRLEHRDTPAQTVAVRVIDDSTGLPAAAAVVARLGPWGDSAVTDSVGHAELPRLAPGRYALVLEPGAFEGRVDSVVVSPVDGTSVEVRLRRRAAVVLANRAAGSVSAAGPR